MISNISILDNSNKILRELLFYARFFSNYIIDEQIYWGESPNKRGEFFIY